MTLFLERTRGVNMQNGRWQVYLSGEIHTDWRDRIAQGAEDN